MSRLHSHLKPIITIKIIDQSYPSSETHLTPSQLGTRKIGRTESTINHSTIRPDTTAVLPSIYKKNKDPPHILPHQLQRNPNKRKRSSKGTLIALAKEYKSIIQIRSTKIAYSSKPIQQRGPLIYMQLLMVMEYLAIWFHSLSLRIYLRYIKMNLKLFNQHNLFLKCFKKSKRHSLIQISMHLVVAQLLSMCLSMAIKWFAQMLETLEPFQPDKVTPILLS